MSAIKSIYFIIVRGVAVYEFEVVSRILFLLSFRL